MARFAASSTPLAGNATWDSGILLSDVFDTVTGSVFADQAGNVFIEQTADPAGATWDVSTTYAISASDGKGIDEKLLLPFFRVRFVNGSSAQAAFRISVRAAAAGNRY